MALSESTSQQIAELVSANRVVLFMKGTRRMPQCGFSSAVVQILDDLLPDYETVDVLRSPEIRDGIKLFSEWPTIPQLYVDRKFIGGCDIVREMNASGELQKLLNVEQRQPKIPTISVSDAAVNAFEKARADAGNDALRLEINAEFEHDLWFGPRADGDIEVRSNGVVVLLDRATARRADGLSIDYVDAPDGGFKVKNPNESPSVKQLSATELKAMLDRNEVTLFDVRPEEERTIARIALARPFDAAGQEYLFSLAPKTPIALHCHHGIRSQQAAQQLFEEGFRNVYNLTGGIDAWSRFVDPTVPRY
jgi:monothiol glutaredoxin